MISRLPTSCSFPDRHAIWRGAYVALSINIDDVTDDDDADALDEGNSTDLAADDDPKPVAMLAKRKIR